MLPAGIMIMTDGRIRSRYGRWLKGACHPEGYRSFDLQVAGRVRKFYFHAVVCEAFHGPRPTPKHEVRHLDGDPTNNAAWNLAWGTKKENAADMVRHGRSTFGNKQWLAKLNREAVRDIRTRYAAGEVRMPQLAAEYGVRRETIKAVIQGRTWSDPEYTPPRRLTLEDARAIRRRHAAGGVLKQELAAEYGVTPSNIGLILAGKTWKESEASE